MRAAKALAADATARLVTETALLAPGHPAAADSAVALVAAQ